MNTQVGAPLNLMTLRFFRAYK